MANAMKRAANNNKKSFITLTHATPLTPLNKTNPVNRIEASTFFFSSRRRHTRCSRDWSSGVCSSDLNCSVAELEAVVHPEGGTPLTLRTAQLRSEERRVGKECRCRWSASD